MAVLDIRFCPPCTISMYKLQNLVLVKCHRSGQNHRKMYLQIIVTLRFSDMLYMYVYMYMLKSHVIFHYCVCVCVCMWQNPPNAPNRPARPQSMIALGSNGSGSPRTQNSNSQQAPQGDLGPLPVGGWVREWKRVVVGYLCSSSDDLAGWSIDHRPPPHTHMHIHTHPYTHMLTHTHRQIGKWEYWVMVESSTSITVSWYINYSFVVYVYVRLSLSLSLTLRHQINTVGGSSFDSEAEAGSCRPALLQRLQAKDREPEKTTSSQKTSEYKFCNYWLKLKIYMQICT